MDSGVEQETVDAPVPGDVDEPDKAPLPIGTDVYQTLYKYGIPVSLYVTTPRRPKQLVELPGVDRGIDAIGDTLVIPLCSCQAVLR